MKWITGILASWCFLLTIALLMYLDFSTRAYDEVQEVKKEVEIRLDEIEKLRSDTLIVNINNYLNTTTNSKKK